MQTPPRGALTWPSVKCLRPNGMTGTRCFAQSLTMCCTSSADCANTTASGGWFSSHVVVCPCCSRTACEVTTRCRKPREFCDGDGNRRRIAWLRQTSRRVHSLQSVCLPQEAGTLTTLIENVSLGQSATNPEALITGSHNAASPF